MQRADITQVTSGGQQENLTVYRCEYMSWVVLSCVMIFAVLFVLLMLGASTVASVVLALLSGLPPFAAAVRRAEKWNEPPQLVLDLDGRLHATDQGMPHLVVADHDPGSDRPRLRLMQVIEDEIVRDFGPEHRQITMSPIKTVVIGFEASEEQIMSVTEQMAKEAEQLELESHVQNVLAAERPHTVEMLHEKDDSDLAVVRAALPGRVPSSN